MSLAVNQTALSAYVCVNLLTVGSLLSKTTDTQQILVHAVSPCGQHLPEGLFFFCSYHIYVRCVLGIRQKYSEYETRNAEHSVWIWSEKIRTQILRNVWNLDKKLFEKNGPSTTCTLWGRDGRRIDGGPTAAVDTWYVRTCNYTCSKCTFFAHRRPLLFRPKVSLRVPKWNTSFSFMDFQHCCCRWDAADRGFVCLLYTSPSPRD